LLLGRIVLFESGLFEELLHRARVKRGSLKTLLGKPSLRKRWLCCIFFMMPYFFVYNVLITLAPEFAKARGVPEPVTAQNALLCYSFSAIFGTAISVWVSTWLRKRIAALFCLMIINLILAFQYLFQEPASDIAFYALCAVMGLANYFSLLLFAAIEQFGTNMRATAGTSSISIGRTTLIISNFIFLAFKSAGFDIVHAGAFTSAIVFAIGFLCLLGLRETYYQGMDFLEENI
jgi:hypothetical protein